MQTILLKVYVFSPPPHHLDYWPIRSLSFSFVVWLCSWPIKLFIFSCHLILFLTNQVVYFLMSSDFVPDQSSCVFSHAIWFCSWPIRFAFIFSCHLILFLTNQVVYFLMPSDFVPDQSGLNIGKLSNYRKFRSNLHTHGKSRSSRRRWIS